MDTANLILLIVTAVGAFVGAIIGYKFSVTETNAKLFNIVALFLGGAFVGAISAFFIIATIFSFPIVSVAVVFAGLIILKMEINRRAKIANRGFDAEIERKLAVQKAEARYFEMYPNDRRTTV